MLGIAKRHLHFATMYIFQRSIVFCAIFIYYVSGLPSQITDDAISMKDSISIEDAIPVEDGIPVEDAISIEPDILVEDSTENDPLGTTDDTQQRRRRIVGGLDDDRTYIRGVCPIRVNPTSDLPNLSSPLECARTCNDRERPKICYYRFVVEYYSVLSRACDFCSPNTTNAFCNNCECVPVDGVERPILTVNRMIPGPSIDVCEGDKIVVDVVNNIEGGGLTIHWHGIFQKDTQHYDGAAMVTQCPISEQSTFRYQFNADNAGTHFWHAHTGLQKLDGVFGTLTVRQTQRRDVNSHTYNFDLSRHSIIINDWMHELASSRLPGRLRLTNFQDPDTLLINGKGRYKEPGSGVLTNTELQVFYVTRNNRYRFRMVNAFCTVCSSLLTVEGHDLTIIAVDGVAVKPTVVNSIISVSGERYDFVINANNRIGSYWIQLRALDPCGGRQIQQLAILKYDGSSNDVPQTPSPTFIFPLPEGIILNPLDDQCDDRSRTDAVCLNDLQSAVSVDGDIFTKKPDAKIYLPFRFYRYDLQDLFAPNNFYRFLVAANFRHTASTVDGISLVLPPSPLLTQFDDIPSNMICNDTRKPDNCGDMCACTHVIELPYNGIVELIIVDETGVPGLYHPFHLHGYAFNVMGTGIPNNGDGITVKEIKKLDKKGLLARRRNSPLFKDTIAVPNNGYAIVRFRADNPGYWYLHCHFIYHLATGMGNIFHVASPSDMPRIPQDFPKCGNHIPSITQY